MFFNINESYLLRNNFTDIIGLFSQIIQMELPSLEEIHKILNILSTPNKAKSPFFKLHRQGINLINNIRNTPFKTLDMDCRDDFDRYVFVNEANLAVRQIKFGGKVATIGLRAVLDKLTLCYLDSVVMCDIDYHSVSSDRVAEAAGAAAEGKGYNKTVCASQNTLQRRVTYHRIFNAVVKYAKNFPHLVNHASAVALETPKGIHIYFEINSETYNEARDWDKMAQFLQLICDANYIIKWCLDRSRGFCDKIWQRHSKHAKAASNAKPLFQGPHAGNVIELLNFRSKLAKRLYDHDRFEIYKHVRCMSGEKLISTHLQTFLQEKENYFTSIIMTAISEIDDKTIYQLRAYRVKQIAQLLLSYQPIQKFVTDNFPDKLVHEQYIRMFINDEYEKEKLLEYRNCLFNDDIFKERRAIENNIFSKNKSRIHEIQEKWDRIRIREQIRVLSDKEEDLSLLVIDIIAGRINPNGREDVENIIKSITRSDLAFFYDTNNPLVQLTTVQYFINILKLTNNFSHPDSVDVTMLCMLQYPGVLLTEIIKTPSLIHNLKDVVAQARMMTPPIVANIKLEEHFTLLHSLFEMHNNFVIKDYDYSSLNLESKVDFLHLLYQLINDDNYGLELIRTFRKRNDLLDKLKGATDKNAFYVSHEHTVLKMVVYDPRDVSPDTQPYNSPINIFARFIMETSGKVIHSEYALTYPGPIETPEERANNFPQLVMTSLEQTLDLLFTKHFLDDRDNKQYLKSFEYIIESLIDNFHTMQKTVNQGGCFEWMNRNLQEFILKPALPSITSDMKAEEKANTILERKVKEACIKNVPVGYDDRDLSKNLILYPDKFLQYILNQHKGESLEEHVYYKCEENCDETIGRRYKHTNELDIFDLACHTIPEWCRQAGEELDANFVRIHEQECEKVANELSKDVICDMINDEWTCRLSEENQNEEDAERRRRDRIEQRRLIEAAQREGWVENVKA